jgi:mannose/fructose/N-acetylgalactosamine-specific phosphotransferase system component IIC
MLFGWSLFYIKTYFARLEYTTLEVNCQRPLVVGLQLGIINDYTPLLELHLHKG